MSSYRKFVDFESDLDIPVSKGGDLSTEWIKRSKIADYDDPKEFKDYLNRNSGIFDITRDIITTQYRSIQDKQFDFNRPNFEQSNLFHEGYKAALRDIYKLLPRPKGD